MTYFLLVIALGIGQSMAAQISMKAFKPFTDGRTITDTLLNGSLQNPEEILLILSSNEVDGNEKMILLHNSKGKLTKIAENEELIMNTSLLGVFGNNYPSFFRNNIFVSYLIGSNSSSSEVSIQFEKNEDDGNYYFKQYLLKNYNFGVENLFSRQKITNSQTGKIRFSEATENMILEKSHSNTLLDKAESDYATTKKYTKFIPEGWRLAMVTEGNLNLDDYKKDALLILYNNEDSRIQPLLQQKDGSYKPTSSNDYLIITDETFNVNNIKSIIKNGYFTIEQRIATDDLDYDHRYITFKYDTKTKRYFLHRYDVEHFSGFDTIPSATVTHLTKDNFGFILFEDLDYTPGDYFYEPAFATITGTLVEKQFYGPPNYGETPEMDKKVKVMILKPDYPINVFARIDQTDIETANKTIRGTTDLQTYTLNKTMDLSSYLNKKITLQGTLMQAQSGGHYTPIVLKVNTIISKQ